MVNKETESDNNDKSSNIDDEEDEEAEAMEVTKYFSSDEEEEESDVVADETAVTTGAGGSQTALPTLPPPLPPTPPLRRRYRLRHTQQDESVNLACADAEPPALELLELVKTIAAAKVRKACDNNNLQSIDVAAGKGAASSTNNHSRAALRDRFDSSALVAVTILVEELVRDMMLNWYQRGAALGLEPRTLRTEVFAQLNGAPDLSAIPTALLQNRLEGLFNQSLHEQQAEIELFHSVAILKAKAHKVEVLRRQEQGLAANCNATSSKQSSKAWDVEVGRKRVFDGLSAHLLAARAAYLDGNIGGCGKQQQQ